MPDEPEENRYSKDQLDAIKLEISPLSPKEDEQHKKLEMDVGKTFVDIFGNLLSDGQIKYIQGASIIVTETETEALLLKEFTFPTSIDREKAEIDGKIYIGYGPIKDRENDFPEGQAVGGFSTPSGLTVYRKLKSEKGYSVGQRFMNFERNRQKATEYAKPLSQKESGDLDGGTFGRAVSSTHFARDVAHEKNHSIQDQDIPLPLREAQSYWIQNKVARKMGGGAQSAPPGTEGFISAFDKLYKEFGDDIHRLIWGNIENESDAKSLLDRVKKIMTSDFINSMLPDNLEWETLSGVEVNA